MATGPYFVLSPNTVLSLVGFAHGPDKTVPTPAEDWHDVTVEVVIPALNEERNIVLALASIVRQTLQPQRVVVIDDGSTDHTLDYAKAFCELHGIELLAVHRAAPLGKTPTLKRQSRESDADVIFILDGDTVLESETYIERAVQELYQAKGVACVCGTVLPLRNRDRDRLMQSPEAEAFHDKYPLVPYKPTGSWLRRVDQWLTNLYRSVLYQFLQRFVYRGEMVLFGTIANPVGCAVAYRREYLKQVFAEYEPKMGDDLTHSEDIFIGFALLAEGFRNVQLADVVARSQEPVSHRLPRQLYLWSSAFLQSCFYFDDLLRSPFKTLKRRRHRREHEAAHQEMRKIAEPYRQPFGRRITRELGRPIGWVLLLGAAEKVFFPTVLLAMILLQLWEPLAVTLIAETFISLTLLTVVAKGHRLEYLGKGILATPLRYGSLFYDLVTLGRFGFDLWIRRDRRWRK